jgi:hypothetical protein
MGAGKWGQENGVSYEWFFETRGPKIMKTDFRFVAETLVLSQK